MRQVFFGPSARAEMFEALAWYRSQYDGLGERFIAEVDATVARIAANSQQFPTVHEDIRRARLRRLPYAIFSRIEGEAIHVIACFHSSRDPRQWQGRA